MVLNASDTCQQQSVISLKRELSDTEVLKPIQLKKMFIELLS